MNQTFEIPAPAVNRLREKAASESVAAQEATLRAQVAEEEAVRRVHEINLASEKVRNLEIRLIKLESQDFSKQADEARLAIKFGIENCDVSDPLRWFDRQTLIVLRATEFEKIHGEALKETKSELTAARKHLAELQSGK